MGQKITVYREMSKAEKEKAACKIAPSTVVTQAPMSRAPQKIEEAEDAGESLVQPVRLPRPPPVDGHP